MSRILMRPPLFPRTGEIHNKKTQWGNKPNRTESRPPNSGGSERDHSKDQTNGDTKNKIDSALAPKRSSSVQSQQKVAVDYRSAFVMADLSDTPAHAARLKMIDLLEMAHKNTPGGIFAPGKRPERSESHVSVIEIPVDDMSKNEQINERPNKAAISALRQMQRNEGAKKLALNDQELEIFQGPRGPVKEFEVISLKLVDPDHSLHDFRTKFQSLGGAAMEKSAEMHLTLAYLRIGIKLDENLKKTLLQIARQANQTDKQSEGDKTPGWEQRDFYYSGRYSNKEFVRIKLAEVSADSIRSVPKK